MKRDTRHKRTPDQRRVDRIFIAERYLEKRTLAEIAAELAEIRDYSLSYPQIYYDLKVMRRAWEKEAQIPIAKWKAQELKKLDRQEKASWLGWNNSLKDAEKTVIGTRGENDVDYTETKGQAGDPRFLAELRAIQDRRAKLLGLDAPKEMSLDIGDGIIKVVLPDGGMLDPEKH